MKPSYIKKSIRKNRRNIKNVINYISRLTAPAGGDKWLYENKLKLRSIGESTLKSVGNIKPLPKGNDVPRIYGICSDIVHRFMFSLNEANLISYINDYQSHESYLTINELLYLRDYIVITCFSVIGHEIEKKNSENGMTASAVKLIFEVDDIDFTKVYESVSHSESVLIRDPAGIYVMCDDATKNMYRRKLASLCKFGQTDEYETAVMINKHTEGASGRERHIGYYLLKYTQPRYGIIYFLLLYIAPAIVCAFCALYFFVTSNIKLFISSFLIYLPLRALFRTLITDSFSTTHDADILPRLHIDDIPDSGRTLLTYTTVLYGNKNDDELFNKLKTYSIAYKNDNLGFAVLADLPDSDEKTCKRDEDIISNAINRINEINSCGGSAYLLYRERSYSKSERKYIGSERKRGAQAQLFRAISGRAHNLHIYSGENNDIALTGYKYVLALDSDTKILYSDIKKLIATALHPLNKPIFSSGNGYPVTVSGYGVFVPEVKISLEGAGKWNAYTILRYAYGGRSSYEDAAFSPYKYLFAKGCFCGKGLINVEAYIRTVDGAFPAESILSHDIAEGSRLRCGFAADIRISDGVPAGFLQERKRSHRWIRGDIQALILCGLHIKSESGKKYKNPIGMTDKFIMSEPVVDIITDIITPIAVILSLISGGISGLIIFAAAISPLIYKLSSYIAYIIRERGIPWRKYKNGMPNFYKVAMFDLWRESASLADRMIYTADASYRALYRMKISKRFLLQWTTAAAADAVKSRGMSFYVMVCCGSITTGVLAVLCALTTNIFSCIILLYFGLLWISYPFILYKQNIKPEIKHVQNNEKLALLIEDAHLMWRFFADNVNKSNPLPPDNISYMPEYRIACRTSPTNIGMYLISVVNAYDFGFIDRDELLLRLNDTVSAIDMLEKWHGHLYNWYDTENNSVLYPAYVSTVDSGNLICSLIIVKNAISGFGDIFYECAQRIDSIIKNTDFSKLYNSRRGLFYIGYNGKNEQYDKNVYDLYSSEMLTTSFYAVAAGAVPVEHISALRRLYADVGAHEVMLSWSGSTFEYFMPNIFLPVYERTERSESILAAYEIQHASGVILDGRRIYGRSECAFYDFDDNMNYSYKAHGCKKLALSKTAGDDTVISPYSLYLMSLYDNDIAPMLKKLHDSDLHGKYGFYESVDLTKRRVGDGYGIARLYMSHHIGMSIAACANTCKNNINVSRFMSEPCLASQAELLINKIVINRGRTDISEHLSEITLPTTGSISDNSLIIKSGTAVISNGRIKCVATDNGDISIYDGNMLLTQQIQKGSGRMRILIRADGEVYDCINSESFMTGVKNSAKSTFSSDGAAVFYVNEIVHGEKLIKTELSVTCDANSPSCAVKLDVTGEINELATLYMFYPVINEVGAYYSSPAYSDLFVTSKLYDNNTVCYKRKRSDFKIDSLTVSFITGNCRDVKIYTKADDILPYMYDDSDITTIFAGKSSTADGACVHPVCATVIYHSRDEKYSTGMLLTSRRGGEDESINENGGSIIYKSPLLLNKAYFLQLYDKMKRAHRVYSALAGADSSAVKCAMTLASLIYTQRYHITEAEAPDDNTKPEIINAVYRRDIFWRYGISGDLPVITVFTGSMEVMADRFAIAEIIAAKRYLFCLGVRFDLVIAAECVSYGESGKDIINDIVTSHGCTNIINHTNGIFIINRESIGISDELIMIAYSRGYIDIGCGHVFNIIKREPVSRNTVVRRELDNNAEHKIKYRSAQNAAIIYNGYNSSPWSMVYCNNIFGTQITNKSCGYSWFNNSAESRITSRHIDYLTGKPCESVYIKKNGVYYDLARLASHVIYTRDCVVYTGNAGGVQYELRVGVSVEFPAKLYHLKTITKETVSAELVLYPAVDMLLCKNNLTPLSEDELTVKAISISADIDESVYSNGECLSVTSQVYNNECAFVLSAFKKTDYSGSMIYLRSNLATPESIINAFDEYGERADKLLLSRVYNGTDAWLSSVLPFASYQAVYMRMMARCGYYQPGGAYGFRDQLQDSLAALYFAPDITKEQILRSCFHQYTDGTVQHWWHPGIDSDGKIGDRGLRTRCSDDYMWLPYVTAEYVIATNDIGLLDTVMPYIESAPLSSDEEDRYEAPTVSHERESIFYHCVRAINASFSRGSHGLPKIGSGDWNDGMNAVGIRGMGESVWLAFFFAIVYRKFAQISEIYKADDKLIKLLYHEAGKLMLAAEKTSWDGQWYLRAYDDDGDKIGSIECSECKIDLLPQAFAVFAGADRQRSLCALDSVYRELYDSEHGILRLFAPSYESTDKYGYICRYPSGIRENGGQYTHAAIWCAAAFFEIGDFVRGAKLLRALSPYTIYENGAMSGKYSAEPYFLTADIYYGGTLTGKSGWSGYTGSAAWYYRIAFKYYLGIVINNGEVIITPHYEAGEYTAMLHVSDCEIEISVTHSEPDPYSCDLLYKIKDGESVNVIPNGDKIKISVFITN